MSLSSVIKQTEEVLEDVLQTIRKDYETPYPVLSETDRNKFIEEEGRYDGTFVRTVKYDADKDLFTVSESS